MERVSPIVGHGKGKDVSSLSFVDLSQPVSIYRGKNLPHWEQEGKMQFVTLHLADSLPEGRLEELKELKSKINNKEIILSNLSTAELLSLIGFIDRMLNASYGNCILGFKDIQKTVNDVILYYDGYRYDLYDYVIMSNHIHLLIIPYGEMKKLFSDFKKYTTKQIIKLTGITDTIWHEEQFDHMPRNMMEYSRISEYIKMNPHNQ